MNQLFEVAILTKTLELTRRYGLKLSESMASIDFEKDRKYHLVFPAMPTDPVGFAKFDRMMTALDSETLSQEVIAGGIDELEALLDRAIRLAPRARGI